MSERKWINLDAEVFKELEIAKDILPGNSWTDFFRRTVLPMLWPKVGDQIMDYYLPVAKAKLEAEGKTISSKVIDDFLRTLTDEDIFRDIPKAAED